MDRAISTFDEMYCSWAPGSPFRTAAPQRALPARPEPRGRPTPGHGRDDTGAMRRPRQPPALTRPAEEATQILPRIDAETLAADTETTLVLPRIDAPGGPPCERE